MASQTEKLEAIKSYIFHERERVGIASVDRATKPEPSGEGFGEFAILLDFQLLTTAVGFGGWQELEDNQILDGVYSEVLNRLRHR